MGLFGKINGIFKKKSINQSSQLESMNDAEQSVKTEEAELAHHLNQIVESTYVLEDYKREYQYVTAYFTDIQQIEQMPEAQHGKLVEDAEKILLLQERRKQFMQAPRQLSNSRYKFLLRVEPEVVNGIARLKELEDMRRKIRRDLEYLESEKQGLQYQGEGLDSKQRLYRQLSVVIAFIALMTGGGTLWVSLQYEVDMIGVGAGVLIGSVLAIFLCLLGFSQAKGEYQEIARKVNRAILLQNKVKIKWVNNTNLLDFLYEKFQVNDSKELEYDWKLYLQAKEEERKFQKNTGDLQYYQEQVLESLRRVGLADTEVWLDQLIALVDNREMVEIKHALNVRRQKLRDKMKAQEELRQNSFVCVKGILTQHPELKDQAKEVLTNYHIAV